MRCSSSLSTRVSLSGPFLNSHPQTPERTPLDRSPGHLPRSLRACSSVPSSVHRWACGGTSSICGSGGSDLHAGTFGRSNWKIPCTVRVRLAHYRKFCREGNHTMFISGIADEAGQDIATQVKANKELGWSHIEVRNVNETNLTDVPDDGFDQILRAVTDAKLQISCFASRIANWAKDISDPSSFESDQEELARAIPRMKKAGTPFIRIMSYANKQNMPDAEWRDQAVERISTLARMAEDGEITLLHENCDGWGGLGPAQTLELLAAVNSPALRLVFDTGNTVPHCQDTMDYYQKVRRYIDYVHIKDARKVG
ncbi:MAG: hypothetical protein CO095_19970, partial [Armatimonadetes bacterium CG_4_9_14_3_um_filter_58_7]